MSALWVFGYGSLMWRPGFAFEAQSLARLDGLHRSLCVYSVSHRGTSQKPGLVLGLDEGGECHGVAFRVTPGAENDTIAYLREREQVTEIYHETYRTVELAGVSKETVVALTFVTDRTHPHYAGQLDLEHQERIVRDCCGQSGANIDYVLNTVAHLEALGVHDADLAALAGRLKSKTNTPD